MTIHIVGLGPAGRELLTSETLDLLGSGIPILLRTRHHPTVAELDPDRRWPSCDHLYESGASFEDIYRRVAEHVFEQARTGALVFAVPGNPLIAEKSVALLLERCAAAGVTTRLHAALGYPDVAATALGLDLGNLQLCDAHALRFDTWRPALISQVHNRDVAAELKLKLLEVLPASHRVAILRELATPREVVTWLELAELDRQAWSYLDTLFLPALDPIDDVRRLDGFWYVIERLHAEDGCPWDREQTHESLRPHLLEEAYELLEAIDSSEPARITEELGDVLLQVAMHAAVAQRTGDFTLADVTEHITRKLIRRHPHVFGEATAKSSEQVYQDWEGLKKAEKPEGSILDGVPASMPSLAASQSIQGRARRVGFDWPSIDGPLEKLQEEIGEFARAGDAAAREDEFGDILFVLANIGQRLGIDAEQALRLANEKFRRRFRAMEQVAEARAIDMKALDLAGLDALWDEAKAMEGAGAGPSSVM